MAASTCSDSTLYLIAHLSSKPLLSLAWYGTARRANGACGGRRLCYSGHRDLGCFSRAAPKVPVTAAPSCSDASSGLSHLHVSQQSSQAGLNYLLGLQWSVWQCSHGKPSSYPYDFQPNFSTLLWEQEGMWCALHKQSLGFTCCCC